MLRGELEQHLAVAQNRVERARSAKNPVYVAAALIAVLLAIGAALISN